MGSLPAAEQHHQRRAVGQRCGGQLDGRGAAGKLKLPPLTGRRLALAALVLLLTLALATGGWIATCGFAGCPSTAQIQAFRPSEGGRILDRAGAPIGRLAYVRRINVPLARVPRRVRAAFIAVEDRRFYYHHGVDWRSAARAGFRNLSHLEVREGFSTITMQVVRNAFVPELSQQRSLRRKLIEIQLARRLEHSLTKQQILQLYLNVIYLGNGTFGVEAASRDLFGKSVDRLSVAEAATLAALARGPSFYAPRRHPDRARGRRDLVLTLMAREGYLPPALAERARREPLRLAPTEWHPREERSYGLDPIRAVVDSVLGDDPGGLGDLVVYTTLDSTAQRAAEAVVRRQAVAIERAAGPRYRGGGEPLEGALVALDPRNGEIRALVGGRQAVSRGFNRALVAKRQPGSAFKPFVYAAALTDGFTPASVVDDSPVELEEHGRIWRPVNFGGEYGGPLTLRRALMRSANAATVRLGRSVGERRVAAFAHHSGIRSPLAAVPALTLGASEVTPLELVAAYAPFANGGFRVTPSLVRRIEAGDGTVLWRAPAAKAQRVLGPAEAFQITSMLESVVDGGTGRVVRQLGVRGAVAGKTGTTNNGADVWFVGYTPTLVAGVWFGYDAPRPIAADASGGRLAAPAWAAFYLEGWREPPRAGDWSPPAGMVRRTIDAFNGDLANQWCPVTQREWFKVGTEPTRECQEHHAPLIEQIEDLGRKLGKALRKLLRF
ncbi:MAG TPA: PBP1A family penicillin-binding protein [Gemmatimonadales bacterium]|nr:PBP1A family penicillin-binding protein [Gemmatimonadales bacterium]